MWRIFDLPVVIDMLSVLEAMTAGQYLSVQEEHDYLSTSEDLLK